MRKSVAIYDGSFDPPHVSRTCRGYALKTGGFELSLGRARVPACVSQAATAFERRTCMCELAFAGIAGVWVSAVERDLRLPA